MGYMSSIRNETLKEVHRRLMCSKYATDDEVKEIIDDCLKYVCRDFPLREDEHRQLTRELFNRIRRLDVLQDILEDDSVTEIMVNGVQEIFVERNGRIEKSGAAFESKERLLDIIGRIGADVNRSVNIASPILDARLADGSRVNIVLDSIALNGPIMTIRRFPKEPMNAQTLICNGSINEEVLEFLRKLVISGYNILISGGTGSGKTTFLNILSGYIPRAERIITIEDSAELKIMGIENLVRLETRNSNADGVKEISIRDLIKTALRMRPDRLIVGEVRGEEAIDMLQAFNIGQDGSMSTIHANSAKDALSRLETMVMLSTDIPLPALRRQIASGVDIVVQLGRLRDKSRHLLEIIEVVGMNNEMIETSVLYSFEEKSESRGRIIGELICEAELRNRSKLIRAGMA